MSVKMLALYVDGSHTFPSTDRLPQGKRGPNRERVADRPETRSALNMASCGRSIERKGTRPIANYSSPSAGTYPVISDPRDVRRRICTPHLRPGDSEGCA